MIRIWVFDDDSHYLELCTVALRDAGFEVMPFDTAEAVSREIHNAKATAPDCAVLDIQVGSAGDDRGFELFNGIHKRWPSVEVFFMTSYPYGKDQHMEASKQPAHFISKVTGDARQVLVRQIRAWVPEDRKAWRYVGSLFIHLPAREFFWRTKADGKVELDHSQKEILLLLTHRPATLYTYEQIREETGVGRFTRQDLEDDDPPERAEELLRNLVQTQVRRIRRAFDKVEQNYAASHSTQAIDFKRVLQTEEGGYRWNKL